MVLPFRSLAVLWLTAVSRCSLVHQQERYQCCRSSTIHLRWVTCTGLIRVVTHRYWSVHTYVGRTNAWRTSNLQRRLLFNEWMCEKDTELWVSLDFFAVELRMTFGRRNRKSSVVQRQKTSSSLSMSCLENPLDLYQIQLWAKVGRWLGQNWSEQKWKR